MKYTLLLLAVVALGTLAWWRTSKPGQPPIALKSTYDGPIDQYSGAKTLLVAVHARWASVWPLTAAALSRADSSQYDIKPIDADTNRDAVRALGATIVPTVFVYKGRKLIATVPNLTTLEQLPQQ